MSKRALAIFLCFAGVAVSFIVPAQSAGSAYDMCRALAGDPFDSRTLESGVIFGRINSAKAIQQCERAVAKTPKDPLVLYWALRAYLAGGVEQDSSLKKLLFTYLNLREQGEHRLALYHMLQKDDEIRDAVRRHEENIKKRFYWCERKFYGFQLYNDSKKFNKSKKWTNVYSYALSGYYPAILLISKSLCGHIKIIKNQDSGYKVFEDLRIRYKQKHKLSIYALAYSFYKKAKIETGEDNQLRVDQTFFRGLNQDQILNHMLPILYSASGKPPLHIDYSNLISALEDDLETTSTGRGLTKKLGTIEVDFSADKTVSDDDVKFLQTLLAKPLEEFHGKDRVFARASNLLALMEFSGKYVSQKKESAIARWYEVAKRNNPYSASSLFNLFSHRNLLHDKQRYFITFGFNPDNLSFEEQVVYASLIIGLEEFENKSSNRYNVRATLMLMSQIEAPQLHGVGYAPPNPTRAEQLFEWLNTDLIAKDRAEKAATFALIVGGLAILATIAGNAFPQDSGPDSCSGLNGLGWIDNTAGNAAAVFGCRKY